MRTLNTAQSAFVVFSLKREFFREYLINPGASSSVKMTLKNVVSIFRSTSSISHVWLQLACSEDADQTYMRIMLERADGVRKKFDLALKEASRPSQPPPPSTSQPPCGWLARPPPITSSRPFDPLGHSHERCLFEVRVPAQDCRRPGDHAHPPRQFPAKPP